MSTHFKTKIKKPHVNSEKYDSRLPDLETKLNNLNILFNQQVSTNQQIFYAKGNENQAERLKSNKPRYSLDHIVRERYPTIVDAIWDLEDCFVLCFLYQRA